MLSSQNLLNRLVTLYDSLVSVGFFHRMHKVLRLSVYHGPSAGGVAWILRFGVWLSADASAEWGNPYVVVARGGEGLGGLDGLGTDFQTV